MSTPTLDLQDRLLELERLNNVRRRADSEAREEALKRLQDWNWNWYASGMTFDRVKDAIRRQLMAVPLWSDLYAYYFDALTTMILIERDWREREQT